MYQYKAVLKHSKILVAKGHNFDDIQKQIIHYRRGQKHGDHTNMNSKIEIIHVKRDQLTGMEKEEIIKVV